MTFIANTKPPRYLRSRHGSYYYWLCALKGRVYLVKSHHKPIFYYSINYPTSFISYAYREKLKLICTIMGV